MLSRGLGLLGLGWGMRICSCEGDGRRATGACALACEGDESCVCVRERRESLGVCEKERVWECVREREIGGGCVSESAPRVFQQDISGAEGGEEPRGRFPRLAVVRDGRAFQSSGRNGSGQQEKRKEKTRASQRGGREWVWSVVGQLSQALPGFASAGFQEKRAAVLAVVEASWSGLWRRIPAGRTRLIKGTGRV